MNRGGMRYGCRQCGRAVYIDNVGGIIGGIVRLVDSNRIGCLEPDCPLLHNIQQDKKRAFSNAIKWGWLTFLLGFLGGVLRALFR